MMAQDDTLNDSNAVRIASNFLLHAPPGEFNEVFSDVRMLLHNDTLLQTDCALAFTQYNKEQFMPVRVEGSDKQTLITPFNELSNGRFYDPRTNKSFKYEHLRKEASDLRAENTNLNPDEPWRKFLQDEADKYIDSHYEETGAVALFLNGDAVIVCIESHRYQHKNFWNGRWRSQWVIPLLNARNGEQREIKGIIKVHVHYYEDGNVQLVSTKEITAKVFYTADAIQTAKDVFKAIWEEESKYQEAVQENYQQMSVTTFKALRRQLPVTGVKFDWTNTHAYRINRDLKPQ